MEVKIFYWSLQIILKDGLSTPSVRVLENLEEWMKIKRKINHGSSFCPFLMEYGMIVRNLNMRSFLIIFFLYPNSLFQFFFRNFWILKLLQKKSLFFLLCFLIFKFFFLEKIFSIPVFIKRMRDQQRKELRFHISFVYRESLVQS